MVYDLEFKRTESLGVDAEDPENPLWRPYSFDMDASEAGENFSVSISLRFNGIPNPYLTQEQGSQLSEMDAYLKKSDQRYII